MKKLNLILLCMSCVMSRAADMFNNPEDLFNAIRSEETENNPTQTYGQMRVGGVSFGSMPTDGLTPEHISRILESRSPRGTNSPVSVPQTQNAVTDCHELFQEGSIATFGILASVTIVSFPYNIICFAVAVVLGCKVIENATRSCRNTSNIADEQCTDSEAFYV